MSGMKGDRRMLENDWAASREELGCLAVEHLSFSYGKRAVLDKVSFRARTGRICALLGTNGAGKSTLLKCINGLLAPKDGRVLWRGMDTSELPMGRRAAIYGYVPQDTERGSALGVMETVLSGRLPHMGFRPSGEDLEKTEEILKELGLADFAFRRMADLSGGERQRVLIGRALAQDPEVLLLDEPTSSLDLRYQYAVMELLRQLARKKGLVVVAVLHDLNLALDFADQAVLLAGGKAAADGAVEEVLVPERIREAYGMEVEIGIFGKRRVVLPVI